MCMNWWPFSIPKAHDNGFFFNSKVRKSYPKRRQQAGFPQIIANLNLQQFWLSGNFNIGWVFNLGDQINITGMTISQF